MQSSVENLLTPLCVASNYGYYHGCTTMVILNNLHLVSAYLRICVYGKLYVCLLLYAVILSYFETVTNACVSGNLSYPEWLSVNRHSPENPATVTCHVSTAVCTYVESDFCTIIRQSCLVFKSTLLYWIFCLLYWICTDDLGGVGHFCFSLWLTSLKIEYMKWLTHFS